MVAATHKLIWNDRLLQAHKKFIMWHPLSPWNLPCVSSTIENCLIVNHGWFSKGSHVRIFFLGGFPGVYLVIFVKKLLSHQLTTHHNVPIVLELKVYHWVLFIGQCEGCVLWVIHGHKCFCWCMHGLLVIGNPMLMYYDIIMASGTIYSTTRWRQSDVLYVWWLHIYLVYSVCICTVYAQSHTYIHTYAHIHIHTYICTHIYVCTYVCVYTQVRKQMHMYA